MTKHQTADQDQGNQTPAVYFPDNPTKYSNAVSAAIAYATTNKAGRFRLTLINRARTTVIVRYIAHADNWIMCQLVDGQLAFISSDDIVSVTMSVLPNEY